MYISQVEVAVKKIFADTTCRALRYETTNDSLVEVFFYCSECRKDGMFPVFDNEQGLTEFEMVKAGISIHQREHELKQQN